MIKLEIQCISSFRFVVNFIYLISLLTVSDIEMIKTYSYTHLPNCSHRKWKREKHNQHYIHQKNLTTKNMRYFSLEKSCRSFDVFTRYYRAAKTKCISSRTHCAWQMCIFLYWKETGLVSRFIYLLFEDWVLNFVFRNASLIWLKLKFLIQNQVTLCIGETEAQWYNNVIRMLIWLKSI